MSAETPDVLSAQPAPSWSGVTIAAGAVLAGLALGRSGRVGLAAGVAAAASVQLLNAGRRGESRQQSIGASSHESPLAGNTPVSNEAAPHHEPEVEADWVDSDAVFFDHLIPTTEDVGELLRPKSLPVLDDEGQPLKGGLPNPVGTTALPGLFISGPEIWEQGQLIESRSDGTSETVWFGLNGEAESVIPSPVVSIEKSAFEELTEPPLAESTKVLSAALYGELAAPGQSSSLLPAPESVAGPESPQARVPESHSEMPMPSNFILMQDEEPLERTVPMPLPGLSSSAWTSKNAVTEEVKVTPKMSDKLGLPRPRRTGELPKHMPEVVGATPSSHEAERSAFSPRTEGKRIPATKAAPSVHPRVLIPTAPMGVATSRKSRLPLLLLVMVVVSAALIGLNWWSNGALLSRLTGLSWLQRADEPGALPPAMLEREGPRRELVERIVHRP